MSFIVFLECIDCFGEMGAELKGFFPTGSTHPYGYPLGHDDYCNTVYTANGNPDGIGCQRGEGDCDSDPQCFPGICGTNNCERTSGLYESSDDCCKGKG